MFKIGMKVEHELFGMGEVIDIDGCVLKIKFNCGIKSILDKYFIQKEFERLDKNTLSNLTVNEMYLNVPFEYAEETVDKLNKINLFELVKKYVEEPNLINVDACDLDLIFVGKDIILANQEVKLIESYEFTHIISEESSLFIGLDLTDKFGIESLKIVDKIIDKIKSKCVNVEIIYATSFDNSLSDNEFRILIINTKGMVNYNLDEIYKECKEANDFSINYIQTITNLGFVECDKIKRKLLNRK